MKTSIKTNPSPTYFTVVAYYPDGDTEGVDVVFFTVDEQEAERFKSAYSEAYFAATKEMDEWDNDGRADDEFTKKFDELQQKYMVVGPLFVGTTFSVQPIWATVFDFTMHMKKAA